MQAAGTVVTVLLAVFLLLVICRFIMEILRSHSSWRPHGVALVLAEATYTVTDPPVRMIRRVAPSLTLGGLRIDMALLVLFVVTSTLIGLRSVVGR
ncbi:MAG TPA: YggT family protein [Dermatophilaceae bacterium]|nr:YggT family protein [Dermatophilaceae bacterium]